MKTVLNILKSSDDDGSPDIIWFRVRDEFVRESFKPSITSQTKRPVIQRSAILLIAKDVVADIKLIEIIDDTIEYLCDAGFLLRLRTIQTQQDN